jgi:hypothetical protein
MLKQLVNCCVTLINVKRPGHRQLKPWEEKYEYGSTKTFASAALCLWAGVLIFNKPQYKVRDKLSGKYVHTSRLETVIN